MIYLFTLLLIDSWVVSGFWLLCVMLLCSSFYMSLGAHMQEFELDNSQQRKCKIGVCLSSIDTGDLFQSGFV